MNFVEDKYQINPLFFAFFEMTWSPYGIFINAHKNAKHYTGKTRQQFNESIVTYS